MPNYLLLRQRLQYHRPYHKISRKQNLSINLHSIKHSGLLNKRFCLRIFNCNWIKGPQSVCFPPHVFRDKGIYPNFTRSFIKQKPPLCYRCPLTYLSPYFNCIRKYLLTATSWLLSSHINHFEALRFSSSGLHSLRPWRLRQNFLLITLVLWYVAV
jgi:hypothetical protein